MNGWIVLACGFAVLRFVGALLRRHGMPFWCQIPGWLLCALAVWMGAGCWEAYFPLWTAALAGGVGWLVWLRWRIGLVRIATDSAVVVLAVVLSVPTLPGLTALMLGGVVAAFGVFADFVVGRRFMAITAQRSMVFAGCVVLALFGLYLAHRQGYISIGRAGANVRELAPMLPHLGITTKPQGERVALPGGGVGWLEGSVRDDSPMAAVFFHGADSDGARQKAARVLRRALLEVGFLVLSVDHPGFGASALPVQRGEKAEKVEAWDPTPNGLAAIAEMEKRIPAGRIVLVGHSMGCSDVLRLCRARADVGGGILFGAGLPDLADASGYWYGRFHEDRRLGWKLDPELVQEIRDHYYNNQRLAEALESGHPPIHFVRFSREHENVKAARDTLFGLIPGPVKAWDLSPSTHYFTTVDLGDVLTGDTRAARACARLLWEIRRELESEVRTAAAPSQAESLPVSGGNSSAGPSMQYANGWVALLKNE